MPLINSSEINNLPVGFLDSGVGGLPYLALAREKLPHERFVYIADTKNYPYGDKSGDAIRHAVLNVIEKFIQRINPKCVVIACNTASVMALQDLRQKFDIPFIGVVPAVKPAAASSENKKIGVLATLQTVKAAYLQKLVTEFAGGCDVTIVPAGNIRDLVEKRFFSATTREKEELLEGVVLDLKKQGVDAVVLGCTHFLHLVSEFKAVLGKEISVIDSREGVINQLVRILQQNRIDAREKNGKDLFYITGSRKLSVTYMEFAQAYNLTFSGTL